MLEESNHKVRIFYKWIYR